MRRFVVLSHNLMDARHLRDLLPRYAAFQRVARRRGGLGVVFLQENAAGAAHAIAAVLGKSWRVAATDREPRLATLYDAARWRCADARVVSLPKLEVLAPHERLYVKGGVPDCAEINHFARRFAKF